jgi:hypothetical protein
LSDQPNAYAALASTLLERWSANYNDAVSERKATSAQGPTDAVAELGAGAWLALQSGSLAALQALDSMAVLTGRQNEPYVVRSGPFSTSLAGAALTLDGPLANGLGSDALPAAAVSLEPSVLPPGETEFRLRADAAGRRGATYTGTVTASTARGEEHVVVWIVVA